jgi:hypothetical protein
MIKQFSYLEPLQTSERNIRILESKNNKRRIYKFNENKYKESNWINAWGSKSKYFQIYHYYTVGLIKQLLF